MTRLFNDPHAFADEMAAGLVAAHADRLAAVTGGVVTRRDTAEGSVAVVIGGGSGHYPAFAGLVGPGLATGAAMGNMFASPSAQQVHSVARASEAGGGVLLCYGNYAGDVLNFDAAQDRLRSEGIECRTVVVTDDISSAPRAERHRRRGVAGDLAVVKVAGAAAAEGRPLDEVERLARRANDRVRSFGVAFSGCTLPGASEPLFSVPEGRMALGLGIHGEPGLGETAIPTADGLAEELVTRLLAEAPEDAGSTPGRLAVLLNGLGAITAEELFVVYGGVARRLGEAGATVIEPEVGNLCTSLDMAGVSLTLLWLDDDLERLWRAPADSVAFRKGALGASTSRARIDDTAASGEVPIPPSTEPSRTAARCAHTALRAVADVIGMHADELGRIDAVAGDGDHGIGMERGSSAASNAADAALAAGAGVRTLLERAGDAWADRAGGTSGALWGLAVRRLAGALADDARPDASHVATGVDAAVRAVMDVGGAAVGDKTMVDALVPFRDELVRRVGAGEDLAVAWTAAAEAATRAAAATADLLPRAGRARPHAERSLGSPDAGAHSFALVATAVGRILSTADHSAERE